MKRKISESSPVATTPLIEMEVNDLIVAGVTIDSKIAALEAQIKKQEEELKKIKGELERRMKELGVTSLSTEAGSIREVQKDILAIENYDELTKFILRTKRLEVFQKRLSVSTVSGLLEEGVKVPGIKTITVTSYKFRKGTL